MRAHAQLGAARVGVQAREDADPQLDVLALQPPHGAAVVVGEACEIAVLHADDVGIAQREVDVEAR